MFLSATLRSERGSVLRSGISTWGVWWEASISQTLGTSWLRTVLPIALIAWTAPMRGDTGASIPLWRTGIWSCRCRFVSLLGGRRGFCWTGAGCCSTGRFVILRDVVLCDEGAGEQQDGRDGRRHDTWDRDAHTMTPEVKSNLS